MKVTDVRTKEQKKEQLQKWKKQYPDDYSLDRFKNIVHEHVSEKEYVEACEQGAILEAYDDYFKNKDYEGFLLSFVVNSFKEKDDYGFYKACPIISQIVDEKNTQKKQREDDYEYVREIIRDLSREPELRKRGKEEGITGLFSDSVRQKLGKKNKRDAVLFLLDKYRGNYDLHITEALELIDGSEAYINKYSPEYLRSMAILYKVMETRGITPSPEEEEKLKYEMLESNIQTLKISKYLPKDRIPTIKKDRFRTRELEYTGTYLFQDIAAFYVNFCSRPKDEMRFFYEIDSHKSKGFYAFDHVFANTLWTYFTTENLRELLFICNDSYSVEDIFKDELLEHGIDVKDITYDAVMSDDNWRSYVFKEHKSYKLGGEKSLGKIKPPLMMEALIDRAQRLNEICVNLEYNDPDGVLKSPEYLHTKWEYYATKIQILLMDIKRATDITAYLKLPESERNKRANKNLYEYWKAQLGKYADDWIMENLGLADEYEEEKEIECPKYAHLRPILNVVYHIESGWYSSKLAIEEKRKLQSQISTINLALQKMGLYSPKYDDIYFHSDKDGCDRDNRIKDINNRRNIKEPYAETFYWENIDLLRREGSSRYLIPYTTRTAENINFDMNNCESLYEANDGLGLLNIAYKPTIIRFDKPFLEAQERAIEMERQDKETRRDGAYVRDTLSSLMALGLDAQRLKDIITLMEKEER